MGLLKPFVCLVIEATFTVPPYAAARPGNALSESPLSGINNRRAAAKCTAGDLSDIDPGKRAFQA